MELRIGIDAAINSIGFVIMVKDGEKIDKTYFYRIVPSTKKPLPVTTSSAELVTYKRFWPTKKSTYSQQDIYKILSAENLVDVMVDLIKKKLAELDEKFEKVSCRIEGSLMASSFNSGASRLNDLVAFGAVMRYSLIKSNLLTEIKIIPPKTLKKLATGNGNAKKEQMISKHQEQFADMNFDYKTGKVDDIIDAFWLCFVEDAGKNKITEEEFNFNIIDKYHDERITALYSEE